MARDAWIYKVTVPAEKSNAFIMALVELELIDEENLVILKQGREETAG